MMVSNFISFLNVNLAHETIYNEPDVIKDAVPDSAADMELEELEEQSEEAQDLDDDDNEPGLSLGDLLAKEDEGEDEPEDFVEEKTTKDGTHIRKEVH
jgi:hypothetical protein